MFERQPVSVFVSARSFYNASFFPLPLLLLKVLVLARLFRLVNRQSLQLTPKLLVKAR